jgi:ADP-glucose pyrophosphorylase
MKRQGKSDKANSFHNYHTDMKTLNAYYQVNDDETKEATLSF